MRILFLFFDGVGLGDDDPEHNAFASIKTPTLSTFTGGQSWLRGLERIESERGIFIPTDTNLGVEGKPQSATGQAAIMTGLNVPAMIGKHYGPKPTPDIRAIIKENNLIQQLVDMGKTAGMLNAYPSIFLDSMKSGKRLPSSNQDALLQAGIPFFDGEAFLDGRALSVDFTGMAWRRFAAENDAATIVWRTKFSRDDTPAMTPYESGVRLAELAESYDFTFFDHWLTDYMGHRGTMEQTKELLTTIDEVFRGLLETWDDAEGLIVVTSDHGNFEDRSQRHHTDNLVPTLIIGDERHRFAEGLVDLTGFAPAILRAFGR